MAVNGISMFSPALQKLRKKIFWKNPLTQQFGKFVRWQTPVNWLRQSGREATWALEGGWILLPGISCFSQSPWKHSSTLVRKMDSEHPAYRRECSLQHLWAGLCQVTEFLEFTWAESLHATAPGSFLGLEKKWRKGLSWAIFFHHIWRVCSHLCSPSIPIMICFVWNLSLQVGRMSSYADICGSKHTQGSTEGGYQRYGVRSYLHQFYEDCTASIWEYEDDFQIQRSPSRWSSVFWKVPVVFYWGERLPIQEFPCVTAGVKYSSRKAFCCTVLPEVAR